MQENSRKTSISASLTMLKPLTVWITISRGKSPQRGVPDTLTCFLRNLYAGQEATVRTRHGTMNWLKIGKGEEQDGRGVGGHRISLSPWIHQEYTFRHRNGSRTPAESGQERPTVEHNIQSHGKFRRTKELEG